MRQADEIKRLADAVEAINADDPLGYYGHHVAAGEPEAVAHWDALRKGVTILLATSVSSPVTGKFGVLAGLQIVKISGHRVVIEHDRDAHGDDHSEGLKLRVERVHNEWAPAGNDATTEELANAEMAEIMRYLVIERGVRLYKGTHHVTAADLS